MQIHLTHKPDPTCDQCRAVLAMTPDEFWVDVEHGYNDPTDHVHVPTIHDVDGQLVGHIAAFDVLQGQIVIVNLAETPDSEPDYHTMLVTQVWMAGDGTLATDFDYTLGLHEATDFGGYDPTTFKTFTLTGACTVMIAIN